MKAERMLTRKEFAEKHNIRSVATIDRWLQHQYLPGAHIDPETREWKIPEESLPPYTRARACKEESILASILRATQQEKSVFASMYHISEEKFQQYIQALLEAKCLKRCKVFHGVPQYIICLLYTSSLKVLMALYWLTLYRSGSLITFFSASVY